MPSVFVPGCSTLLPMMGQGTRMGNQWLGACVPKAAAAVGMLWLGGGWAFVCGVPGLLPLAVLGSRGVSWVGIGPLPPCWVPAGCQLGASWVPCCDIVSLGPY